MCACVRTSRLLRLASKKQISMEEWTKIGREIGVRVSRSRGDRVGQQGVVGTSLYLLLSGEVAIVSESLGTEVSVGAPTMLLQANALIGHGLVYVTAQRHSITQSKLKITVVLSLTFPVVAKCPSLWRASSV